MQVLFATPGAWHLRQTAKALETRNALAGIWCTEKNTTSISASRFRRCWPFHAAMRPFYFHAPEIWIERAFYSFFPLWRMWLAAQRWPDFQVAHSIMGFATEIFEQAEKRGALKVVDCPNSHPASYQRYWQRECDQWCPGEKIPIPQWMFDRMRLELARADVVLCPSRFVYDTMLANGIPAEKCFINPFGSDTALFKPRTAMPAVPRIICVGTICLRKGHQYLFRAFERVKQEFPAGELVCVGGYKHDFRMERPKWEGTFTHYPHLPHSELAKLLQTCTAFVLASVEEGFARVIPEAMASGLPIIATYETGATTLVTDGVEGFIVPARAPEPLAEAMLKLARDPEASRRMGEAAHQKGGERNSWQDYGDRLLAEYERRWSPTATQSHPL